MNQQYNQDHLGNGDNVARDKNVTNYYARPSLGVPFQAPSLPRYFVERPEVSRELKKCLLSQETAQAGTLVVSAIFGLGGIGKSTLATALTYDPEVQSYFPDGIFWATLGQQPDILSFLHSWIQALGDYDFKPTNIDAATLQLRTLLSDKKALLVVDDLWNPDDVDPFQVAGKGCQVLVTTREAPVKGAIRYDLDIMTQEQSLELLTSCLTNELTTKELEKAKTLAKTVGYLPLALELAAAQISEGFTWDELLSGLHEELEILDRLEAEDSPSEEKRKNYSLIASFNLSLKRLSSERLKQFAWLGVLPDDVNITEKMATTLWDCSLIKAKKTLRYLRSKALLLPGFSSDEGTSYRLHDLLLETARSLLTSPTQPDEISQLPGLELSIVQANQQLLERYQKKTKNGLWHSLDDDGYIYNQLIWHFQKASKTKEIHKLLKEETDLGFNGWYSQCEKQGQTAKFIKYVSKAWEIAEETFDKNPTESISLQFRYVLILTSFNSLAKHIRPGLIATLIKKEIWIPAQALAYIRQSQSSKDQAESLRTITKYLPPSLLTSALEIARAISSERYRAWALQGLILHLPKVLPEALEATVNIENKFDRAWALRKFAPYLPKHLFGEVLEAITAFENKSDRVRALKKLGPYLPDDRLSEVLEAARTIVDESDRVSALVGSAPHLPKHLLGEALESARAIENKFDRAWELEKLAPHLPKHLLGEALESARAIENKFDRAWELEKLAPHLPKHLLGEALESARAIENKFDRAWELRLDPDLYTRVEALRKLALHFPQVLPEAVEAMEEIIDVWDEGTLYHEKHVLEKLASYLPSEAVESDRAIGSESYRAMALEALAPYLPYDLLGEALESARVIESGSYRAMALEALAPYLPNDLLGEALESARVIESESYRAMALEALAPRLPNDLLGEALEAARVIESESYRAIVLEGSAPHLLKVLSEALEAARVIESESYYVGALKKLSVRLNSISIDQSFLKKTLHALASRNRSHVLEHIPHLAPLITQFGGIEALREITIAIKDVSRWWK